MQMQKPPKNQKDGNNCIDYTEDKGTRGLISSIFSPNSLILTHQTKFITIIKMAHILTYILYMYIRYKGNPKFY